MSSNPSIHKGERKTYFNVAVINFKWCNIPLNMFVLFNSRCSDGFKLSDDGSICEDIDECSFSPCMNSGTCINLSPGKKTS